MAELAGARVEQPEPPAVQRGECGIDRPAATTSPLATSMTTPAVAAAVAPAVGDVAWR